MKEMKDNSGSVQFDIDQNGIGTIKFYHPLSNSLPGELLKKISDNINLASENKQVKVIILKSEGSRAFCGGASFEELINIQNRINDSIVRCEEFLEKERHFKKKYFGDEDINIDIL